MTKKENIWHNLAANQVFQELKSSPEGLSADEVSRRILRYGNNELPQQKPLSRKAIFFNQFKSILIYVLFAATLLSLIFGDLVDMAVILVAILINVVVGFVQENRAQDALAKLRETIALEATVLRAGQIQKIPAKELVPGDIILLESGDKVPADARLLEVNNLEVMEAALTGEAHTVKKSNQVLEVGTVLAERKNMVYFGTIVSLGKAKAVIAATGLKTEIGRIASLVAEIKEEPTPLQRKLNYFSKFLSAIIFLLSVVILIAGVLKGISFTLMFNTAAALVVAAIPEGLAVAVTVILAVGMQRILKKGSLVRRLLAAEILGSVTVICTDKTGTLTEGDMKVVEIQTAKEHLALEENVFKKLPSQLEEILEALKIAMLCNDSLVNGPVENIKELKIFGSSTEKALMQKAIEFGLDYRGLQKENPRLDEILFDSQKKYMATLHQVNKKAKIVYYKGAPEVILNASQWLMVGQGKERLNQQKRKELSEMSNRLSKKGLRVLAVAYRNVSEQLENFNQEQQPIESLVWVGLFGIKDPLRPGMKETLKVINQAGIRVVIITGDNKLTAKVIAAELSLAIGDENFLDGEQMNRMTDEELGKRVRDIAVYSRVTPEDKYRIVKAWQKQGEIVAMTGDGVNDAPALKQANIGVAFGSGSEVSKESASLVLLDNSVQTIALAVEQGRIIFDNLKKVVLYLLSDCFSGVVIVMGSLLMGLPLPLLPAQILWINLVTDGFPSIALTVEPGEKELMKEPPLKPNQPILDWERWFLILAISILTGLSSLGLFYYYWQTFADLELARTVVFAYLGTVTLLYVFSCRTLRHSIFNSHIFQNRFLWAGVLGGSLLQLLAIYLPPLQELLRTVSLSIREWSLILLVSFTIILLIEIFKWFFIKHYQRYLKK